MWDLDGFYGRVCKAEIVVCGRRILKGLLGNSIRLGVRMDWIYLARNGDGSQAVVDIVMIFHVP
jgi:hypothetical protein